MLLEYSKLIILSDFQSAWNRRIPSHLLQLQHIWLTWHQASNIRHAVQATCAKLPAAQPLSVRRALAEWIWCSMCACCTLITSCKESDITHSESETLTDVLASCFSVSLYPKQSALKSYKLVVQEICKSVASFYITVLSGQTCHWNMHIQKICTLKSTGRSDNNYLCKM